MMYFTFIGNHDKISPDHPYGAALTIFQQYKENLDKVFLFVTPSKRDSAINYDQISKQTKSIMEHDKPGINITLVNLDLDNPVDFDLVYPVMLDATQKIIEDEPIKNAKKIINITSGTPTMTACWVLLQKSGLIPNAKIIQSFETRFARKRGKSTQEVNLEIDDFPKIEAPVALKRQLTIIKREKEKLASKIQKKEIDEELSELIGTSEAIREIKEQILYDIDESTHVLITGERGTGKEVVAQAIWRLYHKEGDEQLAVFNCGTVSKELVTSELFGYKKGAFTGAVSDNEGFLRKYDGRMLFLDEIGNLPMAGQQALLRYLQNGEIRQVGGHEIFKVNTQIIAATNKNINNEEIFAQDLKDRFDDIITLPPIRERKKDIPVLINFFIRRYSHKSYILNNDVLDYLIKYDWPGNVRELEKFVQKIVRRFPEGGTISLKIIPRRIISSFIQEDEEDLILPDLPLTIPIDKYIKKIREKARLQAKGNMSEVDRLLFQKNGTERQRQFRNKKD